MTCAEIHSILSHVVAFNAVVAPLALIGAKYVMDVVAATDR